MLYYGIFVKENSILEIISPPVQHESLLSLNGRSYWKFWGILGILGTVYLIENCD